MKIFVIDEFPPHFLEELQKLPVEVLYTPDTNREKVLATIQDCDILIINSKINVDKEVADAAPRLKMVIRAGVGMDHIDTRYLESRGIRAVSTQGANADSVGEQAVGMLLALQHKILIADRQVKNFEWKREENRGTEIGGKTIGIIGFGNTGKAFSRKISGFEPRLIAYDKYLKGYETATVKEVGMDEIFAESDILTLHIPLTAETRNWVNKDFFAQFSKPLVFLNLSRGPIVNLPDLLQALDSGKVLAAGLDVLENEKFSTLTQEQKMNYENLFSRINVVLTPHIGGWSFESRENINRMILEYVKTMVYENRI
ncbi:MAG: NAD(P)-dependent oxidoreductase [Bacteroidia bacterium]|nr:NAD(P)-dependent oxidoreductase [Bacteroidia bacterium]